MFNLIVGTGAVTRHSVKQGGYCLIVIIMLPIVSRKSDPCHRVHVFRQCSSGVTGIKPVYLFAYDSIEIRKQMDAICCPGALVDKALAFSSMEYKSDTTETLSNSLWGKAMTKTVLCILSSFVSGTYYIVLFPRQATILLATALIGLRKNFSLL